MDGFKKLIFKVGMPDLGFFFYFDWHIKFFPLIFSPDRD
jgi:hypothetical protein